MKIKFWIFFLMAPLTVCAQNTPELGVKAGFSGSKLTIDSLGQEQETHQKAGFYVSAFIELYREKGFNLMGSVGFVEKGGYKSTDIKNSVGIKTGEVRTNYNFQYITLSVYAKLKAKIDEVPKLYPYLHIGPRLDILQKTPSTLDYNYTRNSFGITAGFGVDYDFKKVSAFAEFQKFFNLSSDIANQNGFSIRDNTYVICIGLKFLVFSKQTYSAPAKS